MLDEVREALGDGAYRISGHAADRLLAEGLEEIWVLEATIAGTPLEDFPATFPNPSCLVAGRIPTGATIHALWAYDAASGFAVLLTVYPAGRA